MESNLPKPTSPPPCFAWVGGIWGLFAAMVLGTLAGGNEIVGLVTLVAVPWGVYALDKVRRCQGRFPDRAYSREEEPRLYWFARATAVWSAVALVLGALVAVDMVFNDGAITGIQVR